MLECSACTLRLIRSIVRDHFPTHQRGVALQSRQFRNAQRKNFTSTLGVEIDPTHTPALVTPTSTNFFPGRSHDGLGAPNELRQAEREVITGNRPKKDAISASTKRAIAKELEYISDPVKLKDHVQYTLRCDKPEKALELCRAASKTMSCVVSWNCLIDWHMRRRHTDLAMKIFNEMKKRGQFPDSYTYTILLRSFPQSGSHDGDSVNSDMAAKAVTLYHSMSSPTSRVKPNVKHTNATLNACAVARDMDSLWGVVSKLPERGFGSADHITYSIILTALRRSIDSIPAAADQESRDAQRRQEAINEGRRIWIEIMARWRDGEVHADEVLIAEMADLLLQSRRLEDWDDVLNLVQQTMNIERKLPRVGEEGRQIQHVPQDAESATEISPIPDPDGWVPTPASNAFAVSPSKPSDKSNKYSARSPEWVQPGSLILSRIVRACVLMRTGRTANEYWTYFINDLNMQPDVECYQHLITLLSINRSSARCAAIIKDMEKQGVPARNKTFRMALRVCSRDVKNPNVLGHASSIVKTMQESMFPDVVTLLEFLKLAVHKDDAASQMTAFEQIYCSVPTLLFQENSPRSEKSSVKSAEKEDKVLFFRSFAAAINAARNSAKIADADLPKWETRRAEMDRYVGLALPKASKVFRDRQKDHATAAEYWRARKKVKELKSEMIKQGLAKAPLKMSASQWTERRERFDKAKAARQGKDSRLGDARGKRNSSNGSVAS